MTVTIIEKNKAITELLNGSFFSIKNAVPLKNEITKPQLFQKELRIQFGVLIGIMGDVSGKMIIAGDSNLFGTIGEAMFGMPVEGEMLSSFSGELGNIIAGGMATAVAATDIHIDITSPTVLEGDTVLTGYKTAINVTVRFNDAGGLAVYLLLD
ncbi:chemotaxis protein CheX [Lentibacillus sp. N15]|uniref:chemotaxis protein CheX n=1 Tax=Lentibacillus songyuanensis TaxID=3136161 RepID=UPI0031BBBDEB